MQQLKINPIEEMDISIDYIGNDESAIFVIDNFFANPEEIRDAALSQVYRPSDEYPGFVSPVAMKGFDKTVKWIYQQMISKLYPNVDILQNPGDLPGLSRFSIFAPSEKDRLPSVHYDPNNFIGALVYLCENENSGTAFWRDKATGLETYLPTGMLLQAKMEKTFNFKMREKLEATLLDKPYFSYDQLERDLIHKRIPDEIVFPKTDFCGWEAVHSVKSKFNRLVFYHGWVLHSPYYDNFEYPTSREDSRLSMNIQIPWPINGKKKRTFSGPAIDGIEIMELY